MLNNLKSDYIILIIALIFSINSTPVFSEEINANSFIGKITKNQDYFINWDWWKKFNAPLLPEILKQSVNNNFDLKIADLKIQETQNHLESSKRNYLPFIRLGGEYNNVKYSNLTPYGRYVNYDTDNNNNDLIVMPLQASYELDFWGKNKTREDYFLEYKDFYELEKRFITLNTITEVSSLYFNIVKNEKSIYLYKEINDLKKEKLKIILEKYNLELLTQIDLINAQKELKISEENIITLSAVNEELKNRLNLLVFGDKEKITFDFQNIDNIKLIYDLNLEIDANNIAYRPDILMAEKQIKMAKLDAESVKKSFLPSFKITGDLVQMSELFNDFFNLKNLRYKIGAGILYDLANKDANIAELNAKKNIYEQMLKNYEKTIISSINDVNNSLFYLKSGIKNYERAKEFSELNRELEDIQKQKMNMELITYYDYIETKEKYLISRIKEYESQTECLIHTLSLYKALGGNVRDTL